MLQYGYDEELNMWYVVDDYGNESYFHTEDEAKEYYLEVELIHYDDKFDADFNLLW